MYQSTYGNTMNRGGNNYGPGPQAQVQLVPVNPNAPKLFDAIQEMAWVPIPNTYVFACASWEGSVRFYSIIQVQGQCGIDFMSAVNVQEPAICLDFRGDGKSVFCGLANGCVVEVDVQSQQVRQVGQHELGIRNVFFHQPTNSVISVGFDRCIRFWDINSSQMRPTFEFKLDNIPLVAAQFANVFMYCDSENRICETDWEKLRGTQGSNSRTLFNSTITPLGEKSQITALEITHKHLIMGSIDGRINIQELSRYSSGHRHIITFKAHKTEESYGTGYGTKRGVMHSINSIQANQPRASNNWVATAGSEGEIHIWDYLEKNKIKTLTVQAPITCSRLSHDGNMLVFAQGNDWHRGMEFMGKYQPQISGYVIPNNELFYVK